MTEKERSREKFLARQAQQRQQGFPGGMIGNVPRFNAANRRHVSKANAKHASREEQHGRYLDCGPQAWDDR